MKNIKKRIYNGETLIGCWLSLGSTLTSEIVGMAGFDWVLIDTEHGAGSEGQVLHQLQAVEHTSAASIVRVESYQRQRFHRVLDFGAEGIMCPRIYTLADAEQAVRAIRYQPEGARGVAKSIRAARFGADFEDYYANHKKNLVCIVQIETAEILDSLDSVAATDGVDVLFVGPTDLSIALIKATADAAAKEGKAAGILLKNPEEFKRYYDFGYRFIACGSDGGFVQDGACKTAESLRQLEKSCAADEYSDPD